MSIFHSSYSLDGHPRCCKGVFVLKPSRAHKLAGLLECNFATCWLLSDSTIFHTPVNENAFRLPSPADLRKMGRCPLTPEEAALMLSALGYKHGTYIYLAGSQIYGGKSRMLPFTSLYPNLVTKEDLLTPSELAPFRNFSSQVITALSLTFHV